MPVAREHPTDDLQAAAISAIAAASAIAAGPTKNTATDKQVRRTDTNGCSFATMHLREARAIKPRVSLPATSVDKPSDCQRLVGGKIDVIRIGVCVAQGDVC